jgi:hypothetical protein
MRGVVCESAWKVTCACVHGLKSTGPHLRSGKAQGGKTQSAEDWQGRARPYRHPVTAAAATTAAAAAAAAAIVLLLLPCCCCCYCAAAVAIVLLLLLSPCRASCGCGWTAARAQRWRAAAGQWGCPASFWTARGCCLATGEWPQEILLLLLHAPACACHLLRMYAVHAMRACWRCPAWWPCTSCGALRACIVNAMCISC